MRWQDNAEVTRDLLGGKCGIFNRVKVGNGYASIHRCVKVTHFLRGNVEVSRPAKAQRRR